MPKRKGAMRAALAGFLQLGKISKALGDDLYQYESLDDAGDQIRLLELLPGRFDDDLRCALSTTRLSDKPTYEAVSYVWGDPTVTETIKCNGRKVAITSNLAQALRYLRHESSGSRILWADAVCIDQQNLNERGHQVNLMADIFRNAHEVLVWLGPDGDSTADMAFSAMTEYVVLITDELRIKFLDSRPVSLMDLPEFYTDEPSSSDQACLDAIAQIFANPWFKRVWVLQEVGVARHVRAIRGTHSINFEYLVCFAHVCAKHGRLRGLQLDLVFDALNDLWLSYDAASTWVSSLPFMLDNGRSRCEDVLLVSAQRQVSDPRDHIYAMLGHPVFEHEGSTVIQADYTISFKHLSYSLPVALLEKKAHLSFMSFVPIALPGQSNRAETDPSWLPDYSLVGDHIDRPWFSICKDRLAEAHVAGKRLICRGFSIDSVVLLSEYLQPVSLEPSKNQLQRSADAIFTFEKLLAQHGVRDKCKCENELEVIALALAVTPLAVPKHWANDTHRDKEIEGRTKTLVEFLSIADQVKSLEAGAAASSGADMRIEALVSTAERQRYSGLFVKNCISRRLFLTDNDFVGIGPVAMQAGDRCCVLYGGRVPYILRPLSTAGEYELVGECYVYRMMEGEAMDKLEQGEFTEESFTIV